MFACVMMHIDIYIPSVNKYSLVLGDDCIYLCLFIASGPHGKPMWADHVGPVRDKIGLSGHWLEVGKLCGPHVGSVTCAPHGKPMWVYYMGPTRDLIGQNRHGVELGNNIWGPCCSSNMCPTW